MGRQNPYVGCVAIVTCHMLGRTQMPQLKATNLTFKATLSASKGRVHGRRLDWIIYELTEEILSHFWYQAMRKQHGFVSNLK